MDFFTFLVELNF